MNRLLKGVALSFLTALVCLPAGAEWSLKDWLKELDAKIHRTEEKHKSQLTAAAAIRGTKQDDSETKLYWKGKKKAEPLTEEELNEFKAAVALAEEGKPTEAEKSLNAFLEKRPKSALAADARQTLELMKKGEGKE